MYPVIFDFGQISIFGREISIVINSYGFMLMTAFYSCYFVLNREMKRLKLDENIASDIIVWAAIGGIGGAKLYYLIENFDRVLMDPKGMIFSGAGLVFLGGLIGGTIGVSYVFRKNSMEWFQSADIVAPLLALGYSLGRIGCLLVGDDYGLPTDLPWGISFPNGLPPTTYSVFQSYYPWVDLSGFQPGILKVHPTQIYESVIGFLIFLYLYKIRLTNKVPGSLFFKYLMFAGIERFFIEFIRMNPKYLFNLSGAQLISLGMISISIWFFYFKKKESPVS